ncbi:MAG: ABC transporter permease [Gemmatimonadota bacterium]|nr:ABC transporter permease [Gemmatimonadota bacterium]
MSADGERVLVAGARARMVWSRALAPLIALGAIVIALCALAAVLALAHVDVPRALGAMWSGSFGSADAFASSTLVRATPLILAGLAVALAFRAGVWNIGAEGQLLAGAAATAAIALSFGDARSGGWLVLLIALILGAASGALWAAIAGVLRRRFGVLEVISTIMLNFVALYAVAYLVRGPMQEATHIYPQSPPLAEAVRLPMIVPGSRLHWGFVIALVAAIIQWWVLRSTAAGFRVRASGANPSAAHVAGRIDVERTTLRAFLVSGALAGLAGGVQVTGVTFALYENISPGYGFTAIAVALLAGLDSLGVIATGILFGALESGALAMQREASVPAVVVTTIEAVLILAVVAAARWLPRGSTGGASR